MFNEIDISNGKNYKSVSDMIPYLEKNYKEVISFLRGLYSYHCTFLFEERPIIRLMFNTKEESDTLASLLYNVGFTTSTYYSIQLSEGETLLSEDGLDLIDCDDEYYYDDYQVSYVIDLEKENFILYSSKIGFENEELNSKLSEYYKELNSDLDDCIGYMIKELDNQ